MTLPGWSVENLKGKLPEGYHVREDTDLTYLCFGTEEVCAVFSSAAATVKVIECALIEDMAKRIIEGAGLEPA